MYRIFLRVFHRHAIVFKFMTDKVIEYITQRGMTVVDD
jgi:hypothetical protein